MIQSSLFDETTVVGRFLGVKRWRELREAIHKESATVATPSIGTFGILLALVICLIPIAATLAQPAANFDLATFSFGAAAIFALLLRSRLGLKYQFISDWNKTFHLTHTAVAFGCIPAVIVLLISPNLLTERQDILVQTMQLRDSSGAMRLTQIQIGIFILGIAAWVSLTEELIFRALLVSVIRRWRFISKQQHRDWIAVIASAALFGIAHYQTWGIAATLALVGLGIGFSIAYIATGERLAPVVIYHFIFDVLSIGASLLL